MTLAACFSRVASSSRGEDGKNTASTPQSPSLIQSIELSSATKARHCTIPLSLLNFLIMKQFLPINFFPTPNPSPNGEEHIQEVGSIRRKSNLMDVQSERPHIQVLHDLPNTHVPNSNSLELHFPVTIPTPPTPIPVLQSFPHADSTNPIQNATVVNGPDGSHSSNEHRTSSDVLGDGYELVESSTESISNGCEVRRIIDLRTRTSWGFDISSKEKAYAMLAALNVPVNAYQLRRMQVAGRRPEPLFLIQYKTTTHSLPQNSALHDSLDMNSHIVRREDSLPIEVPACSEKECVIDVQKIEGRTKIAPTEAPDARPEKPTHEENDTNESPTAARSWYLPLSSTSRRIAKRWREREKITNSKPEIAHSSKQDRRENEDTVEQQEGSAKFHEDLACTTAHCNSSPSCGNCVASAESAPLNKSWASPTLQTSSSAQEPLRFQCSIPLTLTFTSSQSYQDVVSVSSSSLAPFPMLPANLPRRLSPENSQSTACTLLDTNSLNPSAPVLNYSVPTTPPPTPGRSANKTERPLGYMYAHPSPASRSTNYCSTCKKAPSIPAMRHTCAEYWPSPAHANTAIVSRDIGFSHTNPHRPSCVEVNFHVCSSNSPFKH